MRRSQTSYLVFCVKSGRKHPPVTIVGDYRDRILMGQITQTSDKTAHWYRSAPSRICKKKKRGPTGKFWSHLSSVFFFKVRSVWLCSWLPAQVAHMGTRPICDLRSGRWVWQISPGPGLGFDTLTVKHRAGFNSRVFWCSDGFCNRSICSQTICSADQVWIKILLL